MNDPLNLLRRLLIVEDDSIAVTLRCHLQNQFPGCVIDVADNVTDAVGLVGRSVANNALYDVAILDFMVPLGKGEVPNQDVVTLHALRTQSPDTIVIRLTAHVKDEMLKLVEGGPEASSGYLEHIFVEKGEDAPGRVAQEIPRALQTRRLRQRMNQLLQRRKDMTALDLNRGTVSGAVGSRLTDRGSSLELAMFYNDAALHWDMLPPKFQNDLEKTFGHVTLSDGSHVVGGVRDASMQSTSLEGDA